MKKLDLKKEYKEYFTASQKKPCLVTIQTANYLCMSGKGDPNTSTAYQHAIEALFSVSYALKFVIKKGPKALDYGVLPLEGLWWVDNMAEFDINNKSNWQWKAMIMQPEFISQELVSEAIDQVQKKKGLSNLDQLNYASTTEGLCAQILHLGPFSDEGPTIECLHQFMNDNGYDFNGQHHEIYLSDVRRCAPEKLKTIIRQPVKKK